MESGIIASAVYLLIAVYMFFVGVYGYIRKEKQDQNYNRERTLKNIEDYSFMIAICCLFWPVTLACVVVIVVGLKIIEFLERIA